MVNAFEVWTLVFTSISVLAFIFLPVVKKIAEWFVTIIHEVGHAVFSVLTGGGISGISLHKNGAGETQTTHITGFAWFTRKVVLFAGYATPIYLGIALLYFAYAGSSMIMFYVLVAIGLLTLIFIRNLFGIIIVFTYLATLAAALFIQNGAFISVLVVFFGLLFFVRGMYDIIVAGYMVFFIPAADGDENFTDFHILAKESWFKIPAQVWYVVYVLVNAVILAVLFYTIINSLTV